MNITEVIAMLESLRDQHGDIGVMVHDEPTQSGQFVAEDTIFVRWIGFNQEWYEPWNTKPFVVDPEMHEKVVVMGVEMRNFNEEHLV